MGNNFPLVSFSTLWVHIFCIRYCLTYKPRQLKSKWLNVVCLFQRLKSQSTKYRTDRTYTTKEAEKQDNVKKNRYKDIVPCTLSILSFPLLHGMVNNIFLHEVKQGSVTLTQSGALTWEISQALQGSWGHNSNACNNHERYMCLELTLDWLWAQTLFNNSGTFV